MERSSKVAVTQALDTAIPSSPTVQSANDLLQAGFGRQITKTVTLTGSGATASDNIFSITESVLITRIYGEVTDATVLVNLTAGFLEIDDGAAQVDFTLSGCVLSGLAVGTIVIRTTGAASALVVGNNAAGAVIDLPNEWNTLGQDVVVQKTGQPTYLRFTYTTTDAPINAQIKWYANWVPITDGGVLAVV